MGPAHLLPLSLPTWSGEPEPPTTNIPELLAIEFIPYAYQIVHEAIAAADAVQVKKLKPEGGANLRWRIDLAPALLAFVMEHARRAREATLGDVDSELVNLSINLVIRRAEK